MVWDYFEACYLINLDSRPEKLALAAEECRRAKIEFVRIPGVVLDKKNYPGLPEGKRSNENIKFLGGGMAHRTCVANASTIGATNCLILEDDVLFVDDILEIIPKVVENLRRMEWDLFHFWHWKHSETTPVNEIIRSTAGTDQTHAYAVNGRFFQRFLHDFDPPRTAPIVLDVALRTMTNCVKLTAFKDLAYQRAGFSDVRGCVSNISAPPAGVIHRKA